jgi:hypothetical protein
MADVSMTAINRWWQATREYSWESLRQSLAEVTRKNVISRNLYRDLRWAVDKLESLGAGFPKSASELYKHVEFYL